MNNQSFKKQKYADKHINQHLVVTPEGQIDTEFYNNRFYYLNIGSWRYLIPGNIEPILADWSDSKVVILSMIFQYPDDIPMMIGCMLGRLRSIINMHLKIWVAFINNFFYLFWIT